MKLYFAPRTAALAAQITLEEAGADYTLVPVDVANGAQRSDEHLSINPLGRVPVLEVNGAHLTEVPAILSYLSQIFPAAELAPHDAFSIAHMQSFNSFLCSTVHIAHAHRMRGKRWVDDKSAIKAMRRKVPQTMHACFEMIENHWFQGAWALGPQYTISDPYLFTMSGWLEGDGVDIKNFPKVHDHFQRMKERPAVKRAFARMDQALHQTQKPA